MLTKAAISVAVLMSGFVAVSDDDFARVVLSQQWAQQPRLDPTGSSWLPLPFWFYGMVLRVAGTTLTNARVTAFVLGILSAALIYLAARKVCSEEASLLGGLIAAAIPWSARLGVATVPELPTGALCLYGIASLCPSDGRSRILGATALAAACLCRYEGWPLAAVFVLFTLKDLRAKSTDDRTLEKKQGILAVAIACSAPLLWLIHQHVHHGHALHFAQRVSAYHKAVTGSGAVADLLAYPAALFREEPELCIMGLILLLLRARQLRREDRGWRLLIASGFLLLLLMVAALRGGAPTHHAGRPLLVLWLALSLWVAQGLVNSYREMVRGRLLLAGATVGLLLLGNFVLRPWYARLDSFSARNDERKMGRAAQDHLRAGQCVLLEVSDFGYFATLAASGQPHAFVLDRNIDPRQKTRTSSFSDAARLRARAAACHLVVAKHPQAEQVLGAPLFRSGTWSLYRGRKAPSNSR